MTILTTAETREENINTLRYPVLKVLNQTSPNYDMKLSIQLIYGIVMFALNQMGFSKGKEVIGVKRMSIVQEVLLQLVM